MKFLDYTGLSRLTNNIKSYIASKLQPIDDRTAFYSPKLVLDTSTGYIEYAQNGSIFDSSGNVTTIYANSTGEKKAMFDRFTNGGFPTALYVDVTSNGLRIPFTIVSGRVIITATQIRLWYRCPNNIVGAKINQIEVRVFAHKKYITVQQQNYVEPEVVDNTPLLPFHTDYWSVDANGSISPSGTHSLQTTAAGSALSTRLSLGCPPAIGVDITLSDGSTKRTVWLYQKTVGNSTASYESGTISNGTYSNKYLRLNVNIDNNKLALNMFASSN